METDVKGATSFSEIDFNAPKSEFGKALDAMCPWFLHYGMTWHEFWYESIDRLADYWQKYQFDIESRNQELWLQGMYIREAVASCLSKQAKYPEKPHRITEMTEAEREEENRRKVEKLREQLMEIKRRSDMRRKESERVDGREPHH